MTEFCIRCSLSDNLGSNWHRVENQISTGKKEFGDFKVIDWFFDPMPDDYDGEFSQGHEGELYIIFEHKGTRYFKKSGTGDSYGNHSWDGPVVEVFPKEVQRIVYVYEEGN